MFPTASKDEDKYAYNDADQMTEARCSKARNPSRRSCIRVIVMGRSKRRRAKGCPAKKNRPTNTTQTTA